MRFATSAVEVLTDMLSVWKVPLYGKTYSYLSKVKRF